MMTPVRSSLTPAVALETPPLLTSTTTQLQTVPAAASTLPLMERMLERVVEYDAKSRLELEKLRIEVVEAKIEAVKSESAAQVQAAEAEAEAKVKAAEAEAEAEATGLKLRHLLEQQQQQQLPALHARLEALHAAKLLSDEELFMVEDAIADSEDARDKNCVSKLIALSAKMPADRAFARQLTRKKWM